MFDVKAKKPVIVIFGEDPLLAHCYQNSFKEVRIISIQSDLGELEREVKEGVIVMSPSRLTESRNHITLPGLKALCARWGAKHLLATGSTAVQEGDAPDQYPYVLYKPFTEKEFYKKVESMLTK
jgi:hypothetical protein